MSDWTSEFVALLDDCELRSDRLTEWQAGFVESLRSQIAEGRQPTQKQIDTLHNIWEKATKNG